jgi:hypothetical protein
MAYSSNDNTRLVIGAALLLVVLIGLYYFYTTSAAAGTATAAAGSSATSAASTVAPAATYTTMNNTWSNGLGYVPAGCPTANNLSNKYCIVSQAEAHTLCDNDPNCAGYGTLSTSGWAGTPLGGYQLWPKGVVYNTNSVGTIYSKN